MVLNYNNTAQKNDDKIMSDLFVFRCQKCSIGKLIFYAGGEYKILYANFSTGITFKIHFLIKKSSFFFFFFFFIKNVEGSEIV